MGNRGLEAQTAKGVSAVASTHRRPWRRCCETWGLCRSRMWVVEIQSAGASCTCDFSPCRQRPPRAGRAPLGPPMTPHAHRCGSARAATVLASSPEECSMLLAPPLPPWWQRFRGSWLTQPRCLVLSSQWLQGVCRCCYRSSRSFI